MYELSRPVTAASDAYAATVATIKDTRRRVPYVDASPVVQSLCENYDDLASSLRFDQARGEAFVVDGLSSRAMVDLYDLQFAQRKGVQSIRDAIKNAAPNSLCPYCGEGSATELDHYLPKSVFAGTTVHPRNLVPACHDCNKAKRAYRPGPGSPPVLHPYFDTAFSVAWLRASVLESRLGLPVVNFSVVLASGDQELEERIRAHMSVFDLWRRFGVWAAQSLANFEQFLKSEHGRSMSLGDARRHLENTAVQHAGGRINSWEGAAHFGMRDSEWYLVRYLGLK